MHGRLAAVASLKEQNSTSSKSVLGRSAAGVVDDRADLVRGLENRAKSSPGR